MGDFERKLLGVVNGGVLDENTVGPNSLQVGEVVDTNDFVLC
jgi:hypothetical protein